MIELGLISNSPPLVDNDKQVSGERLDKRTRILKKYKKYRVKFKINIKDLF